jgi:hypothetical protein
MEAKHKPGDKVRMANGKVTVIPELDGQVIPW